MNTLFTHTTVVTMNEDNAILDNAFVVVRDQTISYVGTQQPQGPFDRVIDGTGKVLLPGLVNSHTHLPMTLLRGYADGYDLHTWLNDYIFPAEARLDSRAVRCGTSLALAELIASGVTCFADMYYFCDDVVEATVDSGLSANICRAVSCFDEANFAFDTYYACREQRELAKRWNGAHDGQIIIEGSIHAEYTSFPGLWRAEADWVHQEGLGIHIHLSETRSEQEACIQRWGKTPAQVMDEAGIWDGRALAAHCVWLTPEDEALLIQKGVSAIHNPVSNLKLGSGVAPVPRYLKNGLNVALGTDGVSSNNSHDMFEEIKLAAILHKGVNLDPITISPLEALAMATRNGAKALGRNTGVVEEGRAADLILVDFRKPGLTPCYDVLSGLVYSARGNDVCLTMARGKVLYEDGDWKTIDVERVMREVNEYGAPLLAGKLEPQN